MGSNKIIRIKKKFISSESLELKIFIYIYVYVGVHVIFCLIQDTMDVMKWRFTSFTATVALHLTGALFMALSRETWLWYKPERVKNDNYTPFSE